MHTFDGRTQLKFLSLHWPSLTENALKDREEDILALSASSFLRKQSDCVSPWAELSGCYVTPSKFILCDAHVSIYWAFTNGMTLIHPFKNLKGKLFIVFIILQSCWDFWFPFKHFSILILVSKKQTWQLNFTSHVDWIES